MVEFVADARLREQLEITEDGPPRYPDEFRELAGCLGFLRLQQLNESEQTFNP
jgi:hypothetical protein